MLRSELASVQSPNDPADIHVFRYIDQLAETLIRFLEYACEEQVVRGVGSKVLGALSTFAMPSLDLGRLPAALEALATGFESFLKKTATLRYATDPIRLSGDGVHYLGLLHTPLGGLLTGRVAKVNPRDGSIPPLLAPIVTFTYAESNVRETVYNHTRNLRNEVHVAPVRSILEMLRLFRTAVAAYLFALEENLPLIRSKVDPIFVYLTKIEGSFEKWEHKYVELTGEEREASTRGWPDPQALEWHDETGLDDGAPWEELAEELGNIPSDAQSPVRTSLLALADAQPRFWLIGEPGAGKSTTLQRLAWLRARELLSGGYLVEPCPVFISANQFDRTYRFRKIISSLLEADAEQVDTWLREGTLWLLVDGVNEVSTSEQHHAYRDLSRILEEFGNTRAILTSRKYGFDRRLDIPVFELLPLNNEMILEYLERNMSSTEQARRLFGQLTGTESLLLDFARNPLLLRMLAQVAQGGQLPSNRGQLFRLFTNWIFSRERKQPQAATPLKERALTTIAFGMRTGGKTYSPQPLVLDWISESLAQWQAKADVSELFCELLDNHILEIDAAGRVTFFHELILEYFSALELQRLYLRDGRLPQEYCQEVKWSEPVIMLAGLLDNADRLIADISSKNIVVAARCVASGAHVTSESTSGILERAREMLTEKHRRRMDALIALLELGTDDALRLVIKAHDERAYSLTIALSRCERPEMVALRLLGFGLTGRKRIRQCLRVFEGKPISRTIIDGRQVAQAERFLLRGEPDNRDLVLIDNIGVSETISDDFMSVVRNILETHQPTTTLWRTAVRVAAHQGFTEKCADVVLERVSQLEEPNGAAHYSIFVACQAMRDLSISPPLALEAARQCLDHGLYALAFKHIQCFELQEAIDASQILGHLQHMAETGRVGLLVEYSEVYGDAIDFYPFLSDAVDQQLSRANLNVILEFYKELVPVLSDKKEILQSVLKEKASALRPETVRKHIRLFQLATYFSGIGMVRKYFEKRGYGFIADLTQERDVFFHISKVVNLEEAGKPRERALVSYAIRRSPRYPERWSATAITILR